MFRSQVIVLYIQKIRDDRTRLILFSKEYGRITCWSKKQVLSDIGNIASVLMERKWRENYLKSIDTIVSVDLMLESYEEISHFLDMIKTLYNLLPESVEQRWLYDDIHELLRIFPDRRILNMRQEIFSIWNIQLFILIHIRILKKLGFLNQWLFHGSDILEYIYHHVEKKLIREIVDGKSLEQNLIESLKKIILQTHYSLNFWT